MAMTSRLRRNGQRPSCEPCRKSKLACDHSFPICGRCRRRKIEGRCHYHPAPMSRRTEYGTGNISPNDSPQPALEVEQVNEVETKWRPVFSLGLEPTTSPGYLGSTSYLSVFQDDNDHGASVPQEAALTKFKSSMSSHQRSALMEEGSRILKIFEWFDALEIVFTRTMQLTGNMLFPSAWIRKGWLTVANRYSQMRTKPYSRERMGEEVDMLFENTFRPLNVHKSTTAEEYIEQFTGENIRWEIIACVFITIARGMTMHPRYHLKVSG